MATRKRKRVLPPWLTGVTVDKKGNPVDQEENKSIEEPSQKSSNSSQPPYQNKETKRNVSSTKQSAIKDEKEENEKLMTPDQVIELSFPEFIFKGSLIYSYNKDDCNLLCDDLLTDTFTTDDDYFIGFDTEWPVTYERGKQAKTSLVQICPSLDKCYLFHISCMAGFPSMLRKVIEAKNIKKVGLNVGYDLWKLEADYGIKAKDIIQTSSIELRNLANQKLKSAENWSLEGLAKNVLHNRISKDPSVRKCDWSQFPLPQAQQIYAATDAAMSLKLYLKLSQMGKSV